MILVPSKRLTDTHLSNPPRQTFITAGIICFSVEPYTRNVYVLLGRETRFDQMDSDDGLWCDFGGKINPGESIDGAAAREFSEESLCTIQLSKDKLHHFKGYKDRIKKMIQDERYFLKIAIILPPRNDDVEYIKVYYLKEVRWQPDVGSKFARIRSQLLENIPYSLRNHPAIKLHEISKEVSVNQHFLEKHAIHWWRIDRLVEVVRNNGVYKHHRFRRSFLPALRTVVSTLCDYYFPR